MPKKAREVAAVLQTKGFVETTNAHKRYVLWANGRKTLIYTEISHGEKEIRNHMLGVMARQLRISRSQLMDLVDCRLTEPTYVKILQEGGHIE